MTSALAAFLVDMKGVRHRLPEVESRFLRRAVSNGPDGGTTEPFPGSLPYRVVANGTELATDEDMLLRQERKGIAYWESPSVLARILAAAGIK